MSSAPLEDRETSEVGLLPAGEDWLADEADAAIPVERKWRDATQPAGVEVGHEQPPRRWIKHHRLGPVAAGGYGIADRDKPAIRFEDEGGYAPRIGSAIVMGNVHMSAIGANHNP